MIFPNLFTCKGRLFGSGGSLSLFFLTFKFRSWTWRPLLHEMSSWHIYSCKTYQKMAKWERKDNGSTMLALLPAAVPVSGLVSTQVCKNLTLCLAGVFLSRRCLVWATILSCSMPVRTPRYAFPSMPSSCTHTCKCENLSSLYVFSHAFFWLSLALQISTASEPKRATALTDRKTGIGCDQLIIMEVNGPDCLRACLCV